MFKNNNDADRMREIMFYDNKYLRESTQFKNDGTLKETLEAKNGKIYGVIQDNSKFYIKECKDNSNIIAENFEFIDGIRNGSKFCYKGLDTAVKQMELKVGAINESLGFKGTKNVISVVSENNKMTNEGKRMVTELNRTRKLMGLPLFEETTIDDTNTGNPEAPETTEMEDVVAPFVEEAPEQVEQDKIETCDNPEEANEFFEEEPIEYEDLDTPNISEPVIPGKPTAVKPEITKMYELSEEDILEMVQGTVDAMIKEGSMIDVFNKEPMTTPAGGTKKKFATADVTSKDKSAPYGGVKPENNDNTNLIQKGPDKPVNKTATVTENYGMNDYYDDFVDIPMDGIEDMYALDDMNDEVIDSFGQPVMGDEEIDMIDLGDTPAMSHMYEAISKIVKQVVKENYGFDDYDEYDEIELGSEFDLPDDINEILPMNMEFDPMGENPMDAPVEEPVIDTTEYYNPKRNQLPFNLAKRQEEPIDEPEMGDDIYESISRIVKQVVKENDDFKKKVLKVDLPTEEPAMDVSMGEEPMGEPAMDDMSTEPAMDDMSAEPAMDDMSAEPAMDDMGTEPAMDGEDADDPKNEIEKLMGELVQKFNEYQETEAQPDNDLAKYLMNSLAATACKDMNPEDKKDIINKVKSADSDEEGMDDGMDTDMDTDMDSDMDSDMNGDTPMGDEGMDATTDAPMEEPMETNPMESKTYKFTKKQLIMLSEQINREPIKYQCIILGYHMDCEATSENEAKMLCYNNYKNSRIVKNWEIDNDMQYPIDNIDCYEIPN